jgi:hypothetical protein
MSEFFRTAMGRKFYDADIPQLVKVLATVICEALLKSDLRLHSQSEYKKALALVQDIIIKSTF